MKIMTTSSTWRTKEVRENPIKCSQLTRHNKDKPELFLRAAEEHLKCVFFNLPFQHGSKIRDRISAKQNEVGEEIGVSKCMPIRAG